MRRIRSFSAVLLGIAMIFSTTLVSAQGAKESVEVDDIADLRSQNADNETVYEITGEVVLTHQHAQRNQKYIQDASAAIVIDDNSGNITTSYDLYDGITGLKGKLSVYQNLLQFVPVEDPGEATSNDNEIVPIEVGLADLAPEHQAMLIKVIDLEFVGEYTTFNPSTSYDIQDASGTGTLRTPSGSANLDYFGTSVPSEAQDMIALVSQFSDDMQIFPRSLEDIYLDGVPAYNVTFTIIGNDDNAIDDATITFGGTTYDAGEYSFENVTIGTYAYEVEKDGYHTKTGSLVVSDQDLEITVVLVEVSDDMVDTFPWEEDFEGDDFPPATWSHYALGEGSWALSSNSNSGDQAAFHTFSTGEANSWLVSPQIQVPEDANYLLKFFERNNFMDDYDYSGVKISTGSGHPNHEEFEEVYESSSAIANYSEKAISLDDFAGKIIYIAFVYKGDDAHQWFIDDIVIEEAPDVIEVANIAELREQEVGSDLLFKITGEVVITHQHGQRNQKYIQDNTAAIIIDDNAGIITTEYELYDGITGLTGKLSAYASLIQFVPEEDPGAATSSGNTIDPLTTTLSDLTPDHQAMLVKIVDLEFDTEQATFTPSTSFDIFDPSGAGTLRTPSASAELDYFDTDIPTSPVTMVALVSQFNDDMQIFPRSLEDFTSDVSGDAEILSFGFVEDEDAIVEFDGLSINVTVSEGTDVTSLTPTITISEGATIDPAGGTPMDFTNPVDFTVTAEDGETTNVYTVNVTVVSAEFELFSNLAAFPNPFNNQITLENAENVTRVRIINLIGQVVVDMPINTSFTTINTRNINSGVYLVIFESKTGERTTRKMIKQ